MTGAIRSIRRIGGAGSTTACSSSSSARIELAEERQAGERGKSSDQAPRQEFSHRRNRTVGDSADSGQQPTTAVGRPVRRLADRRRAPRRRGRARRRSPRTRPAPSPRLRRASPGRTPRTSPRRCAWHRRSSRRRPAASPHTMPNSVPTTGNDTASPADVAGVAHQRREVSRPGHQLDVDVAVELVERGEPGRGRHRVAGQRAGVEHRAERRQVLHEVDPPADRADRQATADHLAEAREVGPDVVLRLRAARPDPEAGDDLVEDQQRTDAVAFGTETVEEPGRRAPPRPCWRRSARR